MKSIPLNQLAKTIRSKNAGVDKITFDIIFEDKDKYDLVNRSGKVTKKSVAELYDIPEERISDFVLYDPANAIKFTVYRSHPSGSPGEGDIFGSQQYAPLLDMQIPVS